MKNPSKNFMYTEDYELSSSILESKTVIIYGAGAEGLRTLFELRQNSIEPVCFVDIDTEKHGTNINGIPVCGLDDMEKNGIGKEVAIIITPIRHKEQITSDLNNRGYRNLYHGHKALDLRETFYFSQIVNEEGKMPVPSRALTEWGETGEEHLSWGAHEFNVLYETIERNNLNTAKMENILEFGCSNCRILRHFTSLPDQISLWGTDIQAEKVFWAMKNLPELNLIVNNVAPPLPFTDGYFGFIFSGSVFTHLVEYHTAWVAELARVIRRGGHAYLTFHDEICSKHIANALKGTPSRAPSYAFAEFLLNDEYLLNKFYDFDFDFLSGGLYHNDKAQAHVFMSRKYIEKITTPFFELIDIVPDAYGNFQTAYLFKRK